MYAAFQLESRFSQPHTMQQLCTCPRAHSMLLSRVGRLAKLSSRLHADCISPARPSHLRPRCRQSLATAAVADVRQTDAHPTVVPRPLGVTDGRWDDQDQTAVDLALQDALKSSKRKSASQPGDLNNYRTRWLCLSTYIHHAF